MSEGGREGVSEGGREGGKKEGTVSSLDPTIKVKRVW